MNPLGIRPRLDRDLPELLQVMRAVHAQDAYPSVWPAEPLAFLAPAQTVAAWVAETGGKAVGQVVLREVEEPLPAWVQATGCHGEEVLVLSRLFVSPSERGQGAARALFVAAWEEARRLDKRAILDVHQKNAAAIRLYDAQGWSRVATVTAPFTDPDGTHPQVHVYVSPT